MSRTSRPRLLILGAGPYQIPVIRAAQRLGCYVITADYTPDNPGHVIADESHIVSTVEHEAILDVARLAGIDGVLTYGSDVSAPTVVYVSERLGLPGNPYSAGRLLQRKEQIRDLQRRLRLPYPAFFAAADREAFAASARQPDVVFPQLVKPVDSSGSKGQSVLTSADQAADAFDRARVFSRCGLVLSERLLEPSIPEIVGDIYIADGRLRFGHYGHNYFRVETLPRVPVGEIMPGFFGADVIAEIDRQLQAIIDAAGVRTGCLNFDAVLADGEVFLLDLGLRCGGNYLDDLIELSSGVDLTEAAVRAALGEEYLVASTHIADARWALSYILNATTAGVFRGYQISPAIRPLVVREIPFARPGDRVLPFSQGDRTLGICLFAIPTREDVLALYPRLPDLIRVDVA